MLHVESGEDSFNIHFDPYDYENRLISKDTLSRVSGSDIHVYYIYDSNTLEVLVPGMGIINKEVNVLSINKDSFSKLIKSMIDSKL